MEREKIEYIKRRASEIERESKKTIHKFSFDLVDD